MPFSQRRAHRGCQKFSGRLRRRPNFSESVLERLLHRDAALSFKNFFATSRGSHFLRKTSKGFPISCASCLPLSRWRTAEKRASLAGLLLHGNESHSELSASSGRIKGSLRGKALHSWGSTIAKQQLRR